MTSLPSCWDVTVSGVFYLYRITIPGDLRASSLATEQIATSGVDLIFVSYTIPIYSVCSVSRFFDPQKRKKVAKSARKSASHICQKFYCIFRRFRGYLFLAIFFFFENF